MRALGLLLGLGCCLSARAALRLPRVITSNMVIQADRPSFFGWATPGATVTVDVVFGPGDALSGSGTASADGSWTVDLPAIDEDQHPSTNMDPLTVHVSELELDPGDDDVVDAVVLRNVLAGDTWLCSGQSNMEFSVAEMLGAEEAMATSDLPGLRLFAVQKNSSQVPLDDLVDTQYSEGWVEAGPDTICGSVAERWYGTAASDREYCSSHCAGATDPHHHEMRHATWGFFSAVCFVHGRALLRETGRPQGLIESCWGGTTIQKWSSPPALAACEADGVTDPPPINPAGVPTTSPPAFSSLWNAMIVPLLRLPIKGAIWCECGSPRSLRFGDCLELSRTLFACRSGREQLADAQRQCEQVPLPDGGAGERLEVALAPQ